MREERMLVRGLHCQRCVGSVERSVKELSGVHAVLVDAATKRFIVVYEEACCDRRHIEWVIYAEGYDVIPSQDFGPAELREILRRQTR